jgi:hypothetical protein
MSMANGCYLFERTIKYLTCRVIAIRIVACLKRQTTASTTCWQFYQSLSTFVTYIGGGGGERGRVWTGSTKRPFISNHSMYTNPAVSRGLCWRYRFHQPNQFAVVMPILNADISRFKCIYTGTTIKELEEKFTLRYGHLKFKLSEGNSKQSSPNMATFWDFCLLL